MTGLGKGVPGKVEPTVAGEELVGVLADLQELHELPELGWVARADVGSTALKVLGASDTPYPPIDSLATEAGIDDDGAADGLSGGFQQVATTVDHVGNLLYGRNVLGVLGEIEEFRQQKVFREFGLFH